MTKFRCKKLDKQILANLLANVEACVFDADGVLWHADNAIDGSINAVKRLVELGKHVAVATNNSAKSRLSYEEKCRQLGYDMFYQDNVVTTSVVFAEYMKNRSFNQKVYIIGSDGISDELNNVGISSCGVDPDNSDWNSIPHYNEHGVFMCDKQEEGIGAVVVGFDKHFNYAKLSKAAAYLSHAECQFYATNADETYPVGHKSGVLLPGTGSILAAVSTGTGRQPTVMGKPNQPMFDYLRRHLHCDADKILMVGDRCSTDIRWARNFGMRSLCVLTGCTAESELIDGKIPDSDMPEYYIDRLGDICAMID